MIPKTQFLFDEDEVWPEGSKCDVELGGVKVANNFPANSLDIWLRVEGHPGTAVRVPHDPRRVIEAEYKDGVIQFKAPAKKKPNTKPFKDKPPVSGEKKKGDQFIIEEAE